MNSYMSSPLNLKDITSLTDLGASLRKFKQGVLQLISEINTQINKDSVWVQEKALNCQRQVEKSQREVEQSKMALYRCQRSGSRDQDGHYQPPNCCAEEEALVKAEAYLKEWQTKLQIAQKWRSQIEQQVTEFNKEERRLSNLATEETGKALQDLGRLIAGYQAVETSAIQVSTRFSGDVPHSTGFDFVNIDQQLLRTEGTHGTLYQKAKKEFFLRSLDDPDVKDSIKGWIRQEIRQSGLNGTWRNPPGFDVGHRIAGIDRPENFHWENSDMNRSRGGKQRR
jgi:hypothetical protein